VNMIQEKYAGPRCIKTPDEETIPLTRVRALDLLFDLLQHPQQFFYRSNGRIFLRLEEMNATVQAWAEYEVQEGHADRKRRVSDDGAREKAAVERSLRDYSLGLQHGKSKAVHQQGSGRGRGRKFKAKR
jgi:hypothetical protein